MHELGRTGRETPFRNLQAYVLEELGRLVVAGRVPPGQPLPTENELAEVFGVSKTVIREATRGLAAKGLVVSRPRSGTRVRPRAEWHLLDPDVLAWQLATDVDPNLLRDFDEFRLAVEPLAVRLAAERASTGDVRSVREALERMRTGLNDPASYFDADLELHVGLLVATQNRMLAGLGEAIRSALRVRHARVGFQVSDLGESFPYHERVVEAVEQGQPDLAVAAMVDLLDLTRRDDHRATAPTI